jgi:hypothetical protein
VADEAGRCEPFSAPKNTLLAGKIAGNLHLSGATAGEPSLKNIELQRYFERIPYWREQGITMAGAGKELAIMAVSTAPSADLKFSPHMLRYRVSSRVGGTTTSGRLENRTIVGV